MIEGRMVLNEGSLRVNDFELALGGDGKKRHWPQSWRDSNCLHRQKVPEKLSIIL